MRTIHRTVNAKMWQWTAAVIMAVSLWPATAMAETNPFASLPLLPSGEIEVAGKTIFTLENGDYVLPHFSPDSHYLAFARELMEGTTELTEIQALDLKTLKVKTLLDAKASREFAVYQSFVTDFQWKDATTLKASISDGDVNGADVILDAASGKLVEKKPLSLDDSHDIPVPAFEAAFPSIPPLVLSNALVNGFKLGNKKYVVQKNYWKEDNHVWLLDAETKKMVKLVEIPDAWIYSLRGAFASGDSVILFAAFGPEAYLARYRGGKLELLYRFPVKNYQQVNMRVAQQQGERVLFQIINGAAYEKRENYFFLYDKSGLKKIKDVTALYDLDVDSAGKFISISQWQNSQRRLVIRELKALR